MVKCGRISGRYRISGTFLILTNLQDFVTAGKSTRPTRCKWYFPPQIDVRRFCHSVCRPRLCVCVCLDIDECPSPNCSANEMCVNEVGSYRCMCRKGFTDNGTQCIGTLYMFLNIFYHFSLSRIVNIHWTDRITNRELWKTTSKQPVLQPLRRRKWNRIRHTLRRSEDSTDKQVLQWIPQKMRTTGNHLEKRSGEGNVDSRLHVQLEEDGDGRTRQSWMKRRVVCGLWYTESDKVQDTAVWHCVKQILTSAYTRVSTVCQLSTTALCRFVTA